MTQPAPGFEGRSTYIDALRGIAAFSVACYHITRYGPLPEPASEKIPGFLQVWFDHGWMGVQVFFVISGFVIAYSVRNAFVTPAYLANYVFRRSLRLDPPYWVTIAFVLLLHAVMRLHMEFDSPLDIPSPLECPLSWHLVGAHLLYLQNILGYFQERHGVPVYQNLSAGFWTLCIEVQFYLLFVAGQGITQRFPYAERKTPYEANPIGMLSVFAPLALLSLFVWNGDYDNDMWIIRFFCMFFLGTAAWWALDGRIPQGAFYGYVVAFIARIVAQAIQKGWEDNLTVGLSAALVTGVSVFLAGRQGKLATWLNYRVLQYLGKISYSLYLIHFPMSHVITTLGTEISGKSPPPAIAALWLVLALAASLAAAHVMYVFVEAPSVRFAARFKPSGNKSPA